MLRKKYMMAAAVWMVAALMTSVVQAEIAIDDTVYWTSQGDAFYHSDRACSANAEECYPISEIAATEFDKKPCALCMGSDEADTASLAKQDSVEKVLASKRGGTWVFQIPESVLNTIETDRGINNMAENTLVGLIGRTLLDVQEVRIAVPMDDAMLMNLRVTDGNAYIVVRPSKAYSENHPLKWRVEVLGRDFFLFDAPEMHLTGVSEILTSAPDTKKQDYSKVFEADYGDMDIAVYRTMESNIAVLHVGHVTESDVQIGTVRIGDDMPEIPVAGYIAKKKGVFCCVLSAAELGALVAGAVPSLNVSVTTDAENDSSASSSDGSMVFLPDLASDAENGG